MQKSAIKKILCAAAVLAIAMFTAGCDDDDNNRHARRHHPASPPHHRTDYDRHRDHRRNPPSPPKHRECPQDKDPQRVHRSDMVGEYKATALNNAFAAKGTSYYIDVAEDDDGLYLTLPNGSEYSIDVDGDTMKAGGGSLTKQAGDSFVYKDKFGGSWLVEKSK